MWIVMGLTFVTMLLAVAAMAVGAAVTGRRLKGSCGGVEGADCLCERTNRPKECVRNQDEAPPLAQLPSRFAASNERRLT